VIEGAQEYLLGMARQARAKAARKVVNGSKGHRLRTRMVQLSQLIDLNAGEAIDPAQTPGRPLR
jgi:hypothetical protein